MNYKKCLVNQRNQSILKKRIEKFDCKNENFENEDLNDFLKKDVIEYHRSLILKTYVYYLENINPQEANIVAFVSFLNDTIEKKVPDLTFNNRFKQFLPKDSHIYLQFKKLDKLPSVKIARIGVDKNYQKKGIGTQIIKDAIKDFASDNNKTGCKFITVDSYQEAIDWYLKLGFKRFPSNYEHDATIFPLYYPLTSILEELEETRNW